jgi:hypothetical protein
MKNRASCILALTALAGCLNVHAVTFTFCAADPTWPASSVEISQTAYENRSGGPADVIDFKLGSPQGFTLVKGDPSLWRWSLGPFYVSADGSYLSTFELIAFTDIAWNGSGWGVQPPWVAFFHRASADMVSGDGLDGPYRHEVCATDGTTYRLTAGTWDRVPEGGITIWMLGLAASTLAWVRRRSDWV